MLYSLFTALVFSAALMANGEETSSTPTTTKVTPSTSNEDAAETTSTAPTTTVTPTTTSSGNSNEDGAQTSTDSPAGTSGTGNEEGDGTPSGNDAAPNDETSTASPDTASGDMEGNGNGDAEGGAATNEDTSSGQDTGEDAAATDQEGSGDTQSPSEGGADGDNTAENTDSGTSGSDGDAANTETDGSGSDATTNGDAETTPSPTGSPSAFIDQYLMDKTVTQPCCGDAQIIPDQDNICKESQISACDTSFFVGNVLDLTAPQETMTTDDQCSCQYAFKYFEFDIDMPSSSQTAEGAADRLKIEETTKWMEVASKQSWPDTFDLTKYEEDDSCNKLYVTQCNEDDECHESLISLQIGNETQIVSTQSKSDWIDGDKSESTCFCYWLYTECPDKYIIEEEETGDAACSFSMKMAFAVITMSFIF